MSDHDDHAASSSKKDRGIPFDFHSVFSITHFPNIMCWITAEWVGCSCMGNYKSVNESYHSSLTSFEGTIDFQFFKKSKSGRHAL